MELRHCLFGLQPAPFVSPNDDWMAANALSLPTDAFRDVIMPDVHENLEARARNLSEREMTEDFEPVRNSTGTPQMQASVRAPSCYASEASGESLLEEQPKHNVDEISEVKLGQQNPSQTGHERSGDVAGRPNLFEIVPPAVSSPLKSSAPIIDMPPSTSSPLMTIGSSNAQDLSQTTSERTSRSNLGPDSMFVHMTSSRDGELPLPFNSPQLPELQQILSTKFEMSENLDNMQDEEQTLDCEDELEERCGDGWDQYDDLAVTGSAQGDAVTNEADELHGLTDGDASIIEGRVDIDSLPVLSNPLQKAGRHTVIRGRLREDHPFAIAAENLGYKLVSREYEGEHGSREEAAARVFFMSDLNAFLKEIGNDNFKIPVIGGGDLDIFMLTKEVMRLGGVHNVVRKRAFRIVAQQLGIPKTCTSAASVLKGAYEKLLFHYEQRLVYGKWPEDPKKAVNMKARVCEEKLKEKRARNAANPRVKGKSDEGLQFGDLSLKTGQEFSKSSRNGDLTKEDVLAQCIPQRLLSLATTPSKEPFHLPLWASEFSAEEEPGEIVKVAKRMGSKRVNDGSEAIMYAVAECFEHVWSDEEDDEKRAPDGYCLARDLLYLPPEKPSARKAQGFLFNLLVMVTGAAGSSEGLRLASNSSSEGLVAGLLHVIQEFYNRYLDGKEDVHIWDMNARLPITVRLTPEMTQNIAAAYCALRILAEISKDERAVARTFKQKDFLALIRVYLSHPGIHPVFVLSVLDVTYNVTLAMSENKERGDVMPVLEGLLMVLEKSTVLGPTLNRSANSASETLPAHNSAVSEKVFRILCIFSLNWKVDEAILPAYLNVLAELLSGQTLVSSMESVAEVAYNLASLHPNAAATHDGFVCGIIQLLQTGQTIDFAVDCLKVMHTAKSLESYAKQVRRSCTWHLLSEEHVQTLADVFSDLFANSNLETGNCNRQFPMEEDK